jgi:pimeloyl-ACP methyl ester carboxylesterase
MRPRIYCDAMNLVPRSFAATMTLLLSACIGPMSAPTPMRYVDHPAATSPAKCLFVFLPGRGDRAETFEQRGFVEALRKRSLSIDVRSADATFGYYTRGAFVERLATDVIAPAKQRGYDEIWLVGPSMGGFGSLFYSRSHADEITGVLAIAPFLGDRDVIEEIANAGGLKPWRAPARAETVDRNNFERELWRWLQAATQGKERAPLLFAGYGKADRLSVADALLTAELPPQRVFLTEGGHEWPAWRRILDSFLDSPDFAGRCRQ